MYDEVDASLLLISKRPQLLDSRLHLVDPRGGLLVRRLRLILKSPQLIGQGTEALNVGSVGRLLLVSLNSALGV